MADQQSDRQLETGSGDGGLANGSGRNPIVLVGGALLLIGAFAFLIFGGLLTGDGAATPVERPLAEHPQSAAIQLPSGGGPLQVGDRPYEFALQDLNGETVTLSQFVGQPILVNFWATWCGPCRIEMPELQAVFQEYESTEGLVVLALDQDETAAEVEGFFDELGLSFLPLLDEGNQTSANYGVPGTLPASVFITPDGEVSVIHRGIMTRGQIDDYLAQTIPGKSLAS